MSTFAWSDSMCRKDATAAQMIARAVAVIEATATMAGHHGDASAFSTVYYLSETLNTLARSGDDDGIWNLLDALERVIDANTDAWPLSEADEAEEEVEP